MIVELFVRGGLNFLIFTGTCGFHSATGVIDGERRGLHVTSDMKLVNFMLEIPTHTSKHCSQSGNRPNVTSSKYCWLAPVKSPEWTHCS